MGTQVRDRRLRANNSSELSGIARRGRKSALRNSLVAGLEMRNRLTGGCDARPEKRAAGVLGAVGAETEGS